LDYNFVFSKDLTAFSTIFLLSNDIPIEALQVEQVNFPPCSSWLISSKMGVLQSGHAIVVVLDCIMIY
jgi:hypothetical protein